MHKRHTSESLEWFDKAYKSWMDVNKIDRIAFIFIQHCKNTTQQKTLNIIHCRFVGCMELKFRFRFSKITYMWCRHLLHQNQFYLPCHCYLLSAFGIRFILLHLVWRIWKWIALGIIFLGKFWINKQFWTWVQSYGLKQTNTDHCVPVPRAGGDNTPVESVPLRCPVPRSAHSSGRDVPSRCDWSVPWWGWSSCDSADTLGIPGRKHPVHATSPLALGAPGNDNVT